MAKWIKQTVDNTPSETASGEIEYRERWKGPYSAGSHPGKSILSRTKVNDTLD